MRKINNNRFIKKVYIILLVMFFCLVSYKALMQNFEAQSTYLEAKNCIIVIDPGHGASDAGAIGSYTKVLEKNINLAVALKLKKLFENAGAKVIMTRESDSPIAYSKDSDMYKRRLIIKNSNADLVISIHMNRFAGSSSVAGPQVYYCKGSEKGLKAAKYVQTQLNKTLAPAKKRKPAIGDYYILESGKSPCILVECGFLSNAREERLLQQNSYQDKIASSIFSGVQQYFNEVPPTSKLLTNTANP